MAHGWRRRLSYSLALTTAVYLACETVVTVRGALAGAPDLFVVCAGEGDLIRFDPASGFRLSQRPWRMAQINQGQLEFTATVRGNSLGFPDRDDFGPQRSAARVPRVAVFGDSFTAGLHLDLNWPDRVEDILTDGGEDVQLLNFSLSGIGLQNWWRMVRDVLEAEDWQVDAVVFAVWGNNLFRRFHIGDAGDGPRLLRGPVTTWDTDAYPDDREQAARWLRPSRMYRVSPADFERALQGRWTPPLSWHPRLATRWTRSLQEWGEGLFTGSLPAAAVSDDLFHPGAEQARRVSAQIDEIAAWIRSKGLRSLVVFIPPRPFLVPGETPDRRPLAEYTRAVRRFSEQLGSRYLDGGLAFSDVPPEHRADFFPPIDLHWNQRGSDQFARFMAPRVGELVAGLPATGGH